MNITRFWRGSTRHARTFRGNSLLRLLKALILSSWLLPTSQLTKGQDLRGLVTEDEKNNVSLFARANRAVVYVNARQKIVTKFEKITPESGIGSGFFFGSCRGRRGARNSRWQTLPIQGMSSLLRHYPSLRVSHDGIGCSCGRAFSHRL